MRIDKILKELDELRESNKEYVKRIEEIEIKNKLLQIKINKIKLLLDAQVTIVNYDDDDEDDTLAVY
tara:strand:+ start:1120 stop:1320 length:201 start_codon:yes stop_codon:yes gene_type:complete